MNNHSPGRPVWVFPQEDPKWMETIVKDFHIHPITAEILVSRGFRSADEIHDYLYAKLPNLHDPNLFLDMEKAVKRIFEALKNKEKILIYGDNDVDGMTGTALLAEFLKHVGGLVEFYVPNPSAQRLNLYQDAFEFAESRECKLIITVDCGITAAKEIQKIVAAGIDVIITDHHEPTDKIPNCVATLNPKLLKQTYPFRELTGVGVAFKLAHGITNFLVSQKEYVFKKIDLKVYLDLVALGTIADMGALLGENRILVRYGLKQLHKTKRIGLTKLCSICELDPAELGTSEIASKIAPRMNSLGRVAEPRKGVELLLVRNEKKAEELAKELDLFNLERQKVEQLVSADVEKMLASDPSVLKNKAIVLSSHKWHPGVIPIICARIAKQYNRPTVLIAVDDNGIGKASIRTIRKFPLLPPLKKCADLLINYGGHDFAAGLTIKEENVERLRKRFIHAANSALKDQDIVSHLQLDAKADFKDLTYDLLASLELFEPFGNENNQPILYCEAKQAWPPKIIGGVHLKLYLEQDRMLEGIAFGMAERKSEMQKKNILLRIAYTPQINRFQNKSSIQLLIKDIQIVGK